jgi:hypothetical protein
MEHRLKDTIRQAIACREYQKARKLWAEYIDGLRAELRRGALTQGKMEEARELLEWARLTMRCQQAHIRQRLSGLRVAGIYGQAVDCARTGASFSGKL